MRSHYKLSGSGENDQILLILTVAFSVDIKTF
jgi:hypothetical protein